MRGPRLSRRDDGIDAHVEAQQRGIALISTLRTIIIDDKSVSAYVSLRYHATKISLVETKLLIAFYLLEAFYLRSLAFVRK